MIIAGRGTNIVPDEKCCDYCGDVIFIGDTFFEHRGMRICGGCARRYAWTVFEEEAAKRLMHFDQLLDLGLEEQ